MPLEINAFVLDSKLNRVCTLNADSREGVNAPANAHLIAAAPEMHALLTALWPILSHDEIISKQIEAVLQKAEGKL